MGDFSIEGDQETFHVGHSIFYGTQFNNFASSLPLYYNRSFTYDCSVWPTSFIFRVKLQRAPDEGGVDCYVSIGRTDDTRIVVEMNVWISAIPDLRGVRIRPRQVGPIRMRRLTETGRRVRAFIPNDILTQLGARHVLFQVSLGVRDCHREKEIRGPFKRRSPPPLPEDLGLLSKM